MDSVDSVSPGCEPLRGKRERFSQMLALDLPAVHAARLAEYPDDGNPVTFAANARKRANERAIKARAAWWRQNQDKEILDAKRERLEGRLWLWHENDIAEYFEMVEEIIFDREGVVIRGADGEPKTRKVQQLKPFEELPRELRLGIKSLKWTERGKPNLELYGADDANRELRKLNGFDKPARTEVSGPNGSPLAAPIINLTGRPEPAETTA